MHCHEIMTVKVESVVPHLTVELAARKMRDHILGFLPVCDEGGRVLGVLTDRDIALRLCAAGRHAGETRVEEIMSRPVVVCHAFDPIARIERLMIPPPLVARPDARHDLTARRIWQVEGSMLAGRLKPLLPSPAGARRGLDDHFRGAAPGVVRAITRRGESHRRGKPAGRRGLAVCDPR